MQENDILWSARSVHNIFDSVFFGHPGWKEPKQEDVIKWIRGWEQLRVCATQLSVELPYTFLAIEVEAQDDEGNALSPLEYFEPVDHSDDNTASSPTLLEMLGAIGLKFFPIHLGDRVFTSHTHLLCHGQLARAHQFGADERECIRARLEVARADEKLFSLAKVCASHGFRCPLGQFQPNSFFFADEPGAWFEMLRLAGRQTSALGPIIGLNTQSGFPCQIVEPGFQYPAALVFSIEPGLAEATVQLIDTFTRIVETQSAFDLDLDNSGNGRVSPKEREIHPRFKPDPCPKCMGKVKVVKTWDSVRDLKCEVCGYTFSQVRKDN